MSDSIDAIVMQTRMEIVKSQYEFFFKDIVDGGLSRSKKLEEIALLTVSFMELIDTVLEENCDLHKKMSKWWK